MTITATMQGIVNFLSGPFRSHKVGSGPPRDPVVAEWFGAAGATAAGVSVTPDKALQSVWVWACVRVLAETLAQLPWIVYKRLDKDGRERDTGHPLWEVLHDQSNKWQTSFEFREMLMGHVVLRGNGYAEIIPSAGNPVAELIPLHPDRVRPFWAPDKTVAYEYQPLDGPTRIILGSEMFHVKGLGFDGLSGFNPIRLHRETIGEDFAAQEYSARFWANDATPSGVLKHPESLSEEAQARLRKSWEQQQTGANRHRPAVLEEGLVYEAIGLTREDAQYVESRKFNGVQIARMFRIQPHMIGILDRATFSNIEAQGIEFVVYTMGPWLRRWEQATRRDLFTVASRRTHFSEFLVDGLLRGDRKARAEFYKSAIINGWMSRNEVRRRENLNPVEHLDEFLVPVNMTLSDALAKLVEDKLDDDAGDDTLPQRSNGKDRQADHE